VLRSRGRRVIVASMAAPQHNLGVSEVAGESRRLQFRSGTAWGAAMAGAILLWVVVAALAPRAERGHIASVDPARGTITLEMLETTGAGPRTFAMPRNVGIQRFDESLSLQDLRPGQWVEVSVRTTGRAGPSVTSIRIVRETHGSASAQEPGPVDQRDRAREKAPTASVPGRS